MNNWKMPKTIKAKWLKALRSGKYRQTRSGKLHNQNSDAYCCLGVLQKCVDGKTEPYLVPSHDWYRINGIEYYYFPQGELTELNDAAHYSFSKIADWIQKNIKGV